MATFSAGLHPLEGVAEEGLSVAAHILRCRRDGDAELLSGAYLAYVSKHAIARLHERGDCHEQGRIAGHVVEAWFARQDGIDALVNQIPFLPRHEDYSLRAAMFQMA